jgi:hypothetical protein
MSVPFTGSRVLSEKVPGGYFLIQDAKEKKVCVGLMMSVPFTGSRVLSEEVPGGYLMIQDAGKRKSVLVL